MGVHIINKKALHFEGLSQMGLLPEAGSSNEGETNVETFDLRGLTRRRTDY